MNLKPFVNNNLLWTDFNSVLDQKIASAHKQLEQITDPTNMHQIQGEIRAYRKLKNLRDEVNNG